MAGAGGPTFTDIPEPRPFIEQEVEPVEEAEPVREEKFIIMELTAYCSCPICCGDNADGVTATGTIPQQGRTVAADFNQFPPGTKLKIGEHIYVVEDTFGSVNRFGRLDVYFESHQEALEFGRRRGVEVIIWEGRK